MAKSNICKGNPYEVRTKFNIFNMKAGDFPVPMSSLDG